MSEEKVATIHLCNRCPKSLSLKVATTSVGECCRECGRYAFEGEEPSYLYLLTHPSLKLHKVGIGTVGKDKGRLALLMSEGWVPYGIWHHADARRTFRWEQETFAWLKGKFETKNGSSPAIFGKWVESWSESISESAISVSELAKVIEGVVTR